MNVQVRDTPSATSLGQRLRQARDAARFSRTQLADATGIPAKSIEKFEADDQEPSVSRLISLATTLGVSLDQLLGKTTSPAQSPNVPGTPAPAEDEDAASSILEELDDMRADGFHNVQRRARAIVNELKVFLQAMEPGDLLKLAKGRGIDRSSCPTSTDLLALLENDAQAGQAACGDIEDRIIDSAVLGADLNAVGRDVLASIADHLKDRFNLEEGLFGWGNEARLRSILREPLRQMAYAGKPLAFDADQSDQAES